MVDANYNELTHTVYRQSVESGQTDKAFRPWDTIFPERLSRLHINPEFASPTTRRQQRRGRDRACAGRFKTQPITFDEIVEVDEEGGVSGVAAAVGANGGSMQGPSGIVGADKNSAEKTSFKCQSEAFSRSVDGLMPGYLQQKRSPSLTGSDKENTPCDVSERVTAAQDASASTSRDAALLPDPDQTGSSGDVSQQNLMSLQGHEQVVLRHQRKRSRKLRNRNTVEEAPEYSEKSEEQPALS